MSSSIKDDLKSFKRSWVHHTGMQLATLTVLTATFCVVAFGLSMALNLSRILASWSDGMQMSVYLAEEATDANIQGIREQIEKLGRFKDITFVSREQATESFKLQTATYAPDLLADADFSNPFPASFKLTINAGVASADDFSRLESLAQTIKEIPRVEDVSYGQSWVRNYASFVDTLTAVGLVMAGILLSGSLFVIGNSIRAAVAARREEVEILELVGATSSMIRRPFVVEGFAMGAIASICALALNVGLYFWQKSMMESSLVMARIVPLVEFLDFVTILAFVVVGGLLGGLGAWLSVRRINDGWSARQGIES